MRIIGLSQRKGWFDPGSRISLKTEKEYDLRLNEFREISCILI